MLSTRYTLETQTGSKYTDAPMKYHFTPTRMGIIKTTCNGCGETRTSYSAGGDIKWYNAFGKSGSSLKG